MRELVQRMNERIQAMKEEVLQQRAVNSLLRAKVGAVWRSQTWSTERNGTESKWERLDTRDDLAAADAGRTQCSLDLEHAKQASSWCSSS